MFSVLAIGLFLELGLVPPDQVMYVGNRSAMLYDCTAGTYAELGRRMAPGDMTCLIAELILPFQPSLPTSQRRRSRWTTMVSTNTKAECTKGIGTGIGL